MSHEEKPGICCWCGWECNPMSQSCGTCARDVTMGMIGMKPLRKDLIPKLFPIPDCTANEARGLRLKRRNAELSLLEEAILEKYEQK
jgi:hypothetical protein